MALFNAMSPLNGGTLDTYFYKTEYPYDLDASLDYTRPALGRAIYPYPLTTGWVSGFCPQFNSQEQALMLGKLPSGPNVNMMYGQIDWAAAFPDLSGGLVKVGG